MSAAHATIRLRPRWPLARLVAVALLFTAGCGADSSTLTSWLVSSERVSLVSWDTAACVAVSPALTVAVDDARAPFLGGGFATGGGFEVPVCTPSRAVGFLPELVVDGTTVDLFDGEVRVGRMEHETLWQQRIPTLTVPDAVRVGDTITLVMSHDDTVDRAFFTFRGGGALVSLDAQRDGVTFSAVVPAAAVGATQIESALLGVRVPVDCTTEREFDCDFRIGAFFEAGAPVAAEGEGEGNNDEGFVGISTEVPPILAAP
jgi:hypothetical protein